MLAALHARDSSNPGDPLLLLKFWLIMDGIYLWEFVTTMNYEWSLIRGHRSYRWTIWIYEIARISTLTSIVMNLVFLNVTARFNCSVWVIFTWIFSFLGLASGSLLIVLRVIAIWHKNNVALGIASGIWTINLGFLISGVARIRAAWNPLANKCVVINLETSKPSLISLFVTDCLLLLLMLAGLLHLRRRGGGTFELGRLLWRQGLIWFTIATIAEFIQVLFLILDVNDVLNNLFLVPCQVTLVISATRLYRALANFSSPVTGSSTQPDESTGHSHVRTHRSMPNSSKHSPFVHVPSSRLEVTVHKAYEEHAMSHTDHFSTSYPGSDGPLHDKPHEISFGDNTDDHAKK
ncbi:hypothetical protein F5888DRAFT_1333173 [Russula emetica]|nr:hypothetical protein F5888DRAFT_1333173 [Russula emetica]